MMGDPNLRIVDWTRLSWHSSERKVHEAEIQRLIKEDGWEPYGELINESSHYAIVLVKYELRENTSDFMQQLFLSLADQLKRIETMVIENGCE